MKWTLDPSHSSIEFTVKHMALTSVRGRFTRFQGEGRTDASGALEWCKVTIDASSIDTAEPQRDGHLRSPDFLDTDRYPEIVFESTAISVTGPDRYEVKGLLNMHGQSRPLTFTLTTTNPIRGMYGEVRVGGQMQSLISRREWGLVWNQVLEFGGMIVSDEVWLSATVQATPEATPNYQVRWALNAATDPYQFTLRYGRLRTRGELQGVCGWLEILDGRPHAMQATFPLNGVQITDPSLPGPVKNLLGLRDQAVLSVPSFESNQSGVHAAQGTLKIGLNTLPVTISVENTNLPGGGTNSLTARVQVHIDQEALARYATTQGLNLSSAGDGLQVVVWFMTTAEQESRQMALA